MEIHNVPREKTYFKNALLEDYYTGKEYLHKYYSYPPSLDSIEDAIQRRNFPNANRAVLTEVLFSQYKEGGIVLDSGETVYQNIKSLKETNTYTITTGQQIHIGLGPLYVWYKIKDALEICKQAKAKYPDYNFVPIFWMASEDHDFEEVNHIPLFGKKYVWEKEAGGTAGRLATSELSDLFSTWFKDLRLNENQEAFIDLCINAYRNSNLADATRKIVHRLFQETGLVVLDADYESLKNLFKPVLLDELRGKNFGTLFKSAEQLNEDGIGAQVVVRECNLFLLDKGKRERLIMGDLRIETIEGASVCDIEEIEKYVEQNAFKLSPNALLRPLYQEWILPNLVYVGGPSEVKYWLQLKQLFANYKLELPIVYPRTSNILFPAKIAQKQPVLVEDFFLEDNAILKQLDHQFNKLQITFEEAYDQINRSLEDYNSLFKSHFPGYNLDGKLKKIHPKVKGLQEIVEGNLKVLANQDDNLSKVLKTRNKYFNAEDIQERNEHILAWITELKVVTDKIRGSFGFENSQKINVILT